MGAGASSCPSPGLSVLKSEDESVLRQIEVDDLSSPPETLLTPPPLPLKLGLEGLDLSSLATQAPFLETLLPPVFQHLVFLNVSSNDLTLTELLPLLQPASPLAALNLSSNPRLFETDAPPLLPLGCADLLLLDVSFCPAPEADEDYLSLRLFLKNFPKLLSFSAESAGLSRALEGVLLHSLPECEELVLADNEIEELGGTLSKMMKLKDLDLRENEATNTGHYRARVQEVRFTPTSHVLYTALSKALLTSLRADAAASVPARQPVLHGGGGR